MNYTIALYIVVVCNSLVHFILPISLRVTSLALGQSSYDCPSASEITLKDMGKCITENDTISTTNQGTTPLYGYLMGYIHGLVQDCSISIALAMEILQSYNKPSILYKTTGSTSWRGPGLLWPQRSETQTKWLKFSNDVLKCILKKEKSWIFIKISLKYVPLGDIGNTLELVQEMAWLWTWLTHNADTKALAFFPIDDHCLRGLPCLRFLCCRQLCLLGNDWQGGADLCVRSGGGDDVLVNGGWRGGGGGDDGEDLLLGRRRHVWWACRATAVIGGRRWTRLAGRTRHWGQRRAANQTMDHCYLSTIRNYKDHCMNPGKGGLYTAGYS